MRIIEITPVIQGEGKTAGKSRLLIRVEKCVLCCKYCDTKYSWGSTLDSPAPKVDFDLLQKYDKWMITGGEPLLYSDKLVDLIVKYHPKWVEVETCGAFLLRDKLILECVDLWNISPKRPQDQLIEGVDATPYFLKEHEYMRDFIIKIVVTPDMTLEELKNIINTYETNYHIRFIKKRIWLMPQTDENGNFLTAEKAWNFALQLSVNYSDRLHIRVFGLKRGV